MTMTADLHARLVARVDGSTTEGRALLAVLKRHRPVSSIGGKRLICIECGGLFSVYPCSHVRMIAEALGIPTKPGSHHAITDDDCTCEFDYPEPDGEESWHYSRTCRMCGTTWGALHCPHDGIQRACPECRWIDPGARMPSYLLTESPWTEG